MIVRVAAAFVMAVMLVGCVTEQAEFQRDGVQYGATKGRFRGRWWNYYERGRSFEDGKFWTQAEADLRTALSMRSKDQRWTRTYGLHFVPEYFPNRELGVTLYYGERYADAIPELEKSLAQTHTARAAYFLNLARAARIKADNADRDPPSLEITPSGVVGAIDTEVTGVARDDTFVGGVTIAGEPYLMDVSAPEVRFSKKVTLAPGANRFDVVVTDLAGKTTTTAVSLDSDVDGPAVSFQGPVVVPGTVHGMAFDPAGVRSFEIAGKAVSLAAPAGAGNKPIEFAVAIEAADLKPPISFACEDTLGNVTRGTVPVRTVIVSELPGGPVFATARDGIVPVGQRLAALVVGGKVIALTLAAQEDPSAPTVDLVGIVDGDKYRMEEIVVDLDVKAANKVAKLELDGRPVDAIIPGAQSLKLSRRIKFEKEGPRQIKAVVQDGAGAVGQSAKTVEYEKTEALKTKNRLKIALLGNVWEGNDPELADAPALIVDQLTRNLQKLDRFVLVSREQMPQVLSEQQLSAALGSNDARLALKQVVPAELFLIGKIHKDSATVDIVLSAISTETTVVRQVDVAGPANSIQDLEELTETLALRLVQEFPMVRGTVTNVVRPDLLVSSLCDADRVRSFMKCLVYRDLADSATGTPIPGLTEVLCEGLIGDVTPERSTLDVIPGDETQPKPPSEIKVNDYVITK